MTAKKLAIFTPLPPSKSGIADYSVELGRALKNHWDITFVIDDSAEDPIGIDCIQFKRLSEWKSSNTDDVIRFYQLGNNIHHAYILRELLDHPGITLMHDFSMHHLLVECTLAKEDTKSYLDLMSAEYGVAGEKLAKLRYENGLHHGLLEFLMPLNQQVITHSKGIIVHSYASLNELQFRFPDTKAIRVPFPYENPDPKLLSGSRECAREQLGIDNDRLVFASFGFVTPPKQIELTLRALAQCKDDIPDFEYILVGEVSMAIQIEKLLEELGLVDCVRITGFVDFAAFHHYIEACDVAMSLRYPSAGETSAALMRAMGLRRANIVFDYASYADYPDYTVVKVPLDTTNNSYLIEAIMKVANDGEYRQSIADAGAEYLLSKHKIEDVANMMSEFIAECDDRECRIDIF